MSGDSVLGCIGAILMAIGVLIWKILAPILIYWTLPYWLCITWFSLIPVALGILLGLSGMLVMTIILVMLASIPSLLFIPLWIMLIAHRVKGRCDRRDYASFCWKWFLRGPFFTFGFFKLLTQCIAKKAQWGSIVEYYKTWFYEVGLS